MAYVTIGNIHYNVKKGKNDKYYYVKDGRHVYTRAKIKSGSKPKTVRKPRKSTRKPRKSTRKPRKSTRKSTKTTAKSGAPNRGTWVKVADGRGVWVVYKSKENSSFKATTRQTYNDILDKLIKDSDVMAVITSAQSSDSYQQITNKARNHGLNSWNTILSKSYYKNFTKTFGSKGPKYRILAV